MTLDNGIGVIGLGTMGAPMAARLAAGGHRVFAWNRSPVAAPAGVELVGSPADLADHADTVLVMVTGPEAVRQVLFDDHGWAANASAGHIVVQSSTIGPDEMRAVGAELASRGVRALDAPVSGSSEPARKGELVVLGGGDSGDFAELAPLFDAIARKVVVFGPVGSGSAVKLAVNAVLISTVAAGAEALNWLLGREPDLDIEQVAGVLERVSPILAGRAQKIAGEPAPSGFPLAHVTKDLRLIEAGSAKHTVLSSVLAVCADAAASGFGETDLAALGTYLRSSRRGRL
ncbi:MAG: NAD-binding protein [Nitriliruptorales bacterium]|nr:NAD-binding protein [Nitriliruptorales bacterium]